MTEKERNNAIERDGASLKTLVELLAAPSQVDLVTERELASRKVEFCVCL